mmetsp:Transcript_34653/g.79349  ORF Transcript_34653/g.79349 Transcript_34653/m.79349 type:complete len:96 (-) Transcript_34653:61-348(-)
MTSCCKICGRCSLIVLLGSDPRLQARQPPTLCTLCSFSAAERRCPVKRVLKDRASQAQLQRVVAREPAAGFAIQALHREAALVRLHELGARPLQH